MTTANSPLSQLKGQADRIAALLKSAERGEKIDARFAEKIKVARTKDSFKTGIVMDDKVITIEMPWAMIRSTDENGLAEYILNLMREAKDSIQ